MKYHLDAKGSDGTDLAKMDRVYADGVRVAANLPVRDDAVTRDEAEIAAGLLKLREYSALTTPTTAQTVAVTKLLCRGLALVVKRLLQIEATED